MAGVDEGAVLDAMRTSRERWTTIRAFGFEWRNHARLHEAFMRAIPPRAHVISAGPVAPRPAEEQETWRLWVSLPDGRVRTESKVGGEVVTAVFEGSTWWSISPFGGAQTNGGSPRLQHGMGPGNALTDPARLISALELNLRSSRDVVAGRPTVLLSCTPKASEEMASLDRHESEVALHELGVGADEYALHIDRERGIVLRTEARFEERPFRIIEITEVAFDEEFPPDTFVLEPPAGGTFKRLERRR